MLRDRFRHLLGAKGEHTATAKKAPAKKAPAKKASSTKASSTKASSTKAATKPAAPAKGATAAKGKGTRADPWVLTTPPGTSEFTAFRDDSLDPPALVVQVGKTELRYHLRALDDLHAMLKKHGDWMPLGGTDEQKPAPDGTVEAWGRAASNPVKGWYGLKKGLRGRFGVYVPMVLAALGRAEVERNPRNNRMRAI